MFLPITTAADLAAAFNTLPDSEKCAFIEMLRQAVPPTLKEAVRLVNAMPESEKQAFYQQVWKQIFKPGLPDFNAKIDAVVRPQVEAIRLADKKLRDPKPRKTDRYAAIHRLRTVEKITDWKTIRKRLREQNPHWVESQKTGKVVSIKTLMNGYNAWLAGREAC
jgi:hypothetical protein